MKRLNIDNLSLQDKKRVLCFCEIMATGLYRTEKKLKTLNINNKNNKELVIRKNEIDLPVAVGDA